MKRPAIFLDRDGTLNTERNFVCSPEELALLPGVLPALQGLHKAGYRLIVLTNQSGVARGLYGEEDLARIHASLHRQLGGLPSAYLHCPHLPGQSGSPYGRACSCRKPGDGLLQLAIELFDPDLGASFLIGDSARDLLMASGPAPRRILLRCGKPWREELARLRAANRAPDLVAKDLAEASQKILEAQVP